MHLFSRVTIRGAQSSQKLSEESFFSERFLEASERASWRVLLRLCGVLRFVQGCSKVFLNSDPMLG